MDGVRFSCDFTMTEDLFREYFAAKDRSMNKRDGLISSVVCGVTFIVYLWAMWLTGSPNVMSIVIGIVILAILVYSVTLAIWGYTFFWPDFAWKRTYKRYFARHGVATDTPRPWSCELYTAATFNDLQTATMDNGRPGPRLAQPFKNYSHVEVTEHLVVVVMKSDVGSILHNMVSTKYADKLMDREANEDAIFSKANLQGGSVDDLVYYLESKLRMH
jgi:hypothetical protein